MSALPDYIRDELPDDLAAHRVQAWADARVAAERERLRVLVQAVRDANHGAQGEYPFRLLTAQQDAAWRELLAALDGPNVRAKPGPKAQEGTR